MRKAIFLTAAAMALLTGGARAQGPAPVSGQNQAGPPLMPTRDVTVLYSVQPDGAPQAQSVRVYFRADGRLMRVDGPPGADGSPQGAMILDRSARTMTVVLNEPRIYMQIPEREEVRSPFVLDASMQFTRRGDSVVAGLACTQWGIVAGKGDAMACVTADGVVLAESGVDGQGNRGHLVAQTVQYAPLAGSLFVPPPGFQRTAHPAGLGQGVGQGGNPGTGPNGGPIISGPPNGPGGAPGGNGL